MRLGAPAHPFNAIAATLLGSSAQATSGFAPAVTPLGILLHVAVMIGVGLVYAALVDRSRRHPVIWALVVAAAAFVATWLLARLFGVGLAVLFSPVSLIAIAVVLAVALTLGMRLALPRV